MAAETHEEYRRARKRLKVMINRGMLLKWNTFRKYLDSDTYGPKLRYRPRSHMMDEQEIRFIVNSLFSPPPLRDRKQYSIPPEEVPLFTEDELSQVVAL